MTIIQVGKIEDDRVKKIKEWDELSDNFHGSCNTGFLKAELELSTPSQLNIYYDTY